MPRSVALNTTYPQELLSQLRDVAQAEGVTVGAFVRRAVCAQLEQHAADYSPLSPRERALVAAGAEPSP